MSASQITPNNVTHACFAETLKWNLAGCPRYTLILQSKTEVRVFDDNGSLTSAIRLHRLIRCICWCSFSGNIAIVTDSAILIYQPVPKSNQWKKVLDIPLEDDCFSSLRQLAWISQGTGLVGGGDFLWFWTADDDGLLKLQHSIRLKHPTRTIRSLNEKLLKSKSYFVSVPFDKKYIYSCTYASDSKSVVSHKLRHQHNVVMVEWFPFCPRFRIPLLASLTEDGSVYIWRSQSVISTNVRASVCVLPEPHSGDEADHLPCLLMIQFNPSHEAKCTAIAWCRANEDKDTHPKDVGDDITPSIYKHEVIWLLTSHCDNSITLWFLDNIIGEMSNRVTPVKFQTLNVSQPSISDVPTPLFDAAFATVSFLDSAYAPARIPPIHKPNGRKLVPYRGAFWGVNRCGVVQKIEMSIATKSCRSVSVIDDLLSSRSRLAAHPDYPFFSSISDTELRVWSVRCGVGRRTVLE
eukprot:959494_1